ncbi:Protein transport protein S9 plasma membrane t-SNARE, variant 2 [Aspergillus fumigatus]
MNAGVAPLPPSEQPAGSGSTKGRSPISTPAPGGIPGDNKIQGYAPNQYGNQGGYGADRFGNAGGASTSRYGPGGYGGLGSTDPNDPTAADRDALFGGARDRVQQQQQNGPPPPYSEPNNAYGGGSNEYNTSTYQERQLTAEEEEEEEIQNIKQEMRFIKQGDVASTRNALRVAAQAEETGRETLARLGAQGERIHDTEKALDVAAIEGRLAEEKAKELKTLNKSMFAVHVSNPFTSARRRRERDEKIIETHRAERATREGTRNEAYQTNQRMERTFREIEREAGKPRGKSRTNVTERAKYQFEADSEDEAMEDEIEQNLDLLSGAASRLNGLARATGRELDEQNRHLERIMGKSDFVDDQIAMNRAKLDRIH